MSKTKSISETRPVEKISVCDLMKINTSKVIKKFEMQTPAEFQQFSDLYTTFLHTMDDFYGTCYISEKEFFDKLNIDQRVLNSLQEYSTAFTEKYFDQIDLFAEYRQEIIHMQISFLGVFDNYLHIMMDSYAKTLSQCNKVMNP